LLNLLDETGVLGAPVFFEKDKGEFAISKCHKKHNDGLFLIF